MINLNRLVIGVIIAGFVYVTPMFKDEHNQYSFLFYVLCLLVNSLHSVFAYAMFVSQMAFYTKISDKKIGGTYMTFLNTITNMGGNWPSTLALYLADWINVKQCTYDQSINSNLPVLNSTTIERIMSNTCGNEIYSNVRNEIKEK